MYSLMATQRLIWLLDMQTCLHTCVADALITESSLQTLNVRI